MARVLEAERLAAFKSKVQALFSWVMSFLQVVPPEMVAQAVLVGQVVSAAVEVLEEPAEAVAQVGKAELALPPPGLTAQAVAQVVLAGLAGAVAAVA